MDKTFCCYCGFRTEMKIPDGDHLPRRICPSCAAVHYENPRIVVGCVPEADDGRILICLRAIEPRRGWWTVPAGFMENGETLRAGAARECQEEALAHVEVGALLALVDIPEAHQVHVFFRAKLTTSAFGAGPESLDAKLIDPRQIPSPFLPRGSRWRASSRIANPAPPCRIRRHLNAAIRARMRRLNVEDPA
jgi:ADP-ribose pyrophosphatase YjhB (NUDIX family)